MTRINTNVSSLVARNTLGRSNAALEQSLTRLSTGLRINTGKDDPAGLIASENLRSDITSIRKAISNTDRANQVIATADSALGQVSSLLNDIRGLVTESANAGALSDEQLAANQLQVDSSLEALNRIAQTTTFQGRRLLDGSLDFITTAGTNFSNIADLKIDQANLGATGSVAVSVNVTTAATRGQVDVTAIPAAAAGVAASGTLTFADAAVGSTGSVDIALLAQQATGSANFDTTVAAGITVTALAGGAAEGAIGAANGGIDVIITDAVGATAASYDDTTNVITVTADLTGGAVAEDDIATAIAAINGGADFTATALGTTALVAGDAGTLSNVATGGRDASTETITIAGDPGVASNIDITVVEDAAVVSGTPVVSGDATNGYTVSVGSAQTTTVQDIRAAIASIAEVASATYAGSASYVGATDSSLNSPTGVTESLTGGSAGGSDVITITSDTTGTTANGVTVSIIEAAAHGTTPTAAIVGGNIQVTVDNTATTTIANIATAINGLTGYGATVTTNTGNGNYIGSSDAPPTAATLAGGTASSGGISADVVLELSGTTGSEVLSFGSGTSIDDVAAGINLVKDATGVEATVNGTTLELVSTAYGSNSLVDIRVISEGATSTPAGTFTTAVADRERAVGTDVVAAINGVEVNGNGNQFSINTASLDLNASIAAGFTGTAEFTITGGGALFQLGPDVVSNQQARLGIGSVNTAKLGGASGKLFQLGDGKNASLSGDATLASSIIGEAIDQVTSLRGRLGAFQRTTLETNKNALNDTLVNLSDAESSIRDADFAVESAALTRAQILVQSGTTVLQISNQNPQNVLSLLR
jgi:flagellin